MTRPGPRSLLLSSVGDQVYAAIRERIVGGELASGVRLHQEDLAAEFGVSRTPVREALRRLSAEGLVELHTNRGARVIDISSSDVVAPTDARIVIEPAAARRAAEQRAPTEAMRDAITRLRAVIPDVGPSFEANRDFHLALTEASGNPYLLQFAQIVWVSRIGVPIYTRQAATVARMQADADEHEAIADAIDDGDSARAEQLARQHVQDALSRLLETS